MCAKLAFFKSMALEVEPFLREFQSDELLVPFLHTELCSVMSSIMEIFMSASALSKLSNVKLKDINNEKNHLPFKNHK